MRNIVIVSLTERMWRQRLQWIIAVSVLGTGFATATPARPLVNKADNKTDLDPKLNPWDTKFEFLLKLGQYTTKNGSLLIDIINAFSEPHTVDIQRLVDQSVPELQSLYSDAPLPTQLENYKRAYAAQASNGNAAKDGPVTAMLEDITTECERLYVTLSSSSSIKDTFFYGVPLAFVHLASLREMFASSEGALKEEYRKDIVLWLVTYWQFIYDGHTSWETSRVQGLDWEADTGTNTCNVTFLETLPGESKLSWQINQCDSNSSKWLSSQINRVQTAYASELHFDMMASISKIFLLHRLVPGYESSHPYLGNFSRVLKRGPVQPLSYQFVPNSTVVKSVSDLEPECQPLVDSQFTGITSFTVRQWDWVDGVQVQYENGLGTFQGNQRGGTAESLSFDPHDTNKCLSSIKWNLSSRLNRVTSITVAARDGTSTGFLGNRKKTADVTIYTTAPMLYCISKVIVCAVTSRKSDNIPAITGFQVVFDIVNGSTMVPEPFLEGSKLLQEPIDPRTPYGSNRSSGDALANDAAAVQLPARQYQEPQRRPPNTEATNGTSDAPRTNVMLEQQRLHQKEEPEYQDQRGKVTEDNRKQTNRSVLHEMEAIRQESGRK